MNQIGPKTDQNGLEVVLLYQKYLFFRGIFLCGTCMLSEEMILNDVSLEGKPHLILPCLLIKRHY